MINKSPILFSNCCFHKKKMKMLFLNLFLKFKNVFSIILKNNLKNEKTNMFGKNVSNNYYWNNFHKLKIKQCILIILILRIN